MYSLQYLRSIWDPYSVLGLFLLITVSAYTKQSQYIYITHFAYTLLNFKTCQMFSLQK